MPLQRLPTRRLHWRAAALLTAVWLMQAGSGAHAEDEPGPPAKQAETQDDIRLETIGYRLAAANADRCSEPQMLTGLMLHDQASYDPGYRAAVARAYGLTYGFGVRQLVAGGIGERAGFRKDDEIIALNGADLKGFAPELIGSKASPDRTERFVDLLDQALRQGPATLTIRRGGSTMKLSLSGEAGCGGRFVLIESGQLDAWADGKYVAVTTKMAGFAKDDEELAFVVAHEMSHNILHHPKRLKHASGVLAELGLGTKEIKATEIEADAYAVGLLVNAGFDLSAPERFLRRSGKARWMDLPTTHPGIARRMAIVNDAVAKLGRDLGKAPPTIRLASAATPIAPITLPFDLPGLQAVSVTHGNWTDGLAMIRLPAPFDRAPLGTTTGARRRSYVIPSFGTAPSILSKHFVSSRDAVLTTKPYLPIAAAESLNPFIGSRTEAPPPAATPL